MTRNPFSVGRWVTGAQFFGRRAMIDAILSGDEPCHWVIGKRRMGKTSMLRQIELEVNTQHPDKFALFWDIQGSYDGKGLFDSLFDAIEDNQDLYPDAWQTLGLELDEADNTPQLLKKLARCATRAKRHLLLLIDESEELVNIGRQDPAILSKLRRFLQTNHNTTTIMVSSPTLEQISSVTTETSPFLHGFSVTYLGNFTEAETDRLLIRGLADPDQRRKIYNLTHGNPFEVQLLARHLFEEPFLDRVLLELETNPTLNQTIEVNFNLLTDDERAVLKEIHCDTLPFQDFERAITLKLARMGYLEEIGPERYVIGSYFQSKWLGIHLLDGREGVGHTHPGEVTEGIVLSGDKPANALKQIMDIYKFFLDLGQAGKRVSSKDGKLELPLTNGVLILDAKTALTTGETRKENPWFLAIQDTYGLLRLFVPESHSWTLLRLGQMVAGGQSRHTEQDFLDLMMLIAEEAELD